jgi:predicted MFS family arabinose efflux permease
VSLTSESGTRSDGLDAAPAGATLERVILARNAVATIFITVGVAFASWAARLPAIQENLGLSAGRLGLTLLALSAGSVLTLPLAGAVVHRLGPIRTLRITTTTIAVMLMLIGFAPSAVVLAAIFFFVGTGMGTCDVAMNVSAVDVEQRLKKPLMSRFHGGFSLGTVFGAAIGAAAAEFDVPVSVHLLVIGILSLIAFTVATSFLLPLVGSQAPVSPESALTRTALPETAATDSRADPATAPSGGHGTSGSARAWREPRTLMLGLLVLGMAFSEGAANDWLAIGLRDGYGLSHAAGALGFGLFVTAMTAGRLAGPWVLDRFGRVLALRAGAVAVIVGVFAVGLGTFLPAGARGLAIAVALGGSMIWGWGAALGFPVGMSAAGDDPARAPARVSVVATIGYLAFIAGPPLLGLLGDHFGTARAILAVTGAVILSFIAAAAAREPETGESAGGRTPDRPNAGQAVDNASEASPLG